MRELPLLAISGTRVRRFANNFRKWRSHEWKLLANRFTSDPKIVIHSNEYVILFLTRYCMSSARNSAKNNYRSQISPLSLGTGIFHLWHCDVAQLIGDVTRTWVTGTTMPSLSIVLARANWRKGDLHQRITTVNIDFSPRGIHGLTCKKSVFFAYQRCSHCVFIWILIRNTIFGSWLCKFTII